MTEEAPLGWKIYWPLRKFYLNCRFLKQKIKVRQNYLSQTFLHPPIITVLLFALTILAMYEFHLGTLYLHSLYWGLIPVAAMDAELAKDKIFGEKKCSLDGCEKRFSNSSWKTTHDGRTLLFCSQLHLDKYNNIDSRRRALKLIGASGASAGLLAMIGDKFFTSKADGPNGPSQNDIQALGSFAAVKSATYICVTDGTYVYGVSGDTGTVLYGGPANLGGATGTSTSSVINACLANLPSGRTWKEKVLVRGNYSGSLAVTSVLLIQNYSILELQGYLQLAPGQTDGRPIITNADQFENYTNGNQEIEIHGGIWDGNAYSSTNTTTSGTSNAGQKTLTVSSTSGFSANQYIVIGKGTAVFENAQISSIGTGSFTLVNNLIFTHAGGQTVTLLNNTAGNFYTGSKTRIANPTAPYYQLFGSVIGIQNCQTWRLWDLEVMNGTNSGIIVAGPISLSSPNVSNFNNYGLAWAVLCHDNAGHGFWHTDSDRRAQLYTKSFNNGYGGLIVDASFNHYDHSAHQDNWACGIYSPIQTRIRVTTFQSYGFGCTFINNTNTYAGVSLELFTSQDNQYGLAALNPLNTAAVSTFDGCKVTAMISDCSQSITNTYDYVYLTVGTFNNCNFDVTISQKATSLLGRYGLNLNGATFNNTKITYTIDQTFHALGTAEINAPSTWVGLILYRENSAYGLITNPFGSSTIGVILGSAAAPTASTTYTTICNDLIITSTGGTGVSITVKDPAGNILADANGVSTLTGYRIPAGYTISFGGFSVAPTVSAYVAR